MFWTSPGPHSPGLFYEVPKRTIRGKSQNIHNEGGHRVTSMTILTNDHAYAGTHIRQEVQ
jgi:hypothetical protein